MPKLSKYNYFYPWREGYHLAYNARSGAVALMTEENYRALAALKSRLSESTPAQLSAEEQLLLSQLQHGLFVHPDELSELDALKFRHRSARFGTSSLGFVVAPTMACNMACEYCFEENKRGRMSRTVIDDFVKFISKRAASLETVEITWYGGEPLLAMDIIEEVTLRILDLAAEQKFKYYGAAISNGYLLTPENVDRLLKLRVGSVQITIDGPGRLHNQKRPLKNGKDSFATIIENLKYASTKMAVIIRVNVDKSFTPEIVAELLDELEEAGLKEHIAVNFGLLEPASSACANIAENCYDVAEFSRAEIAFYAEVLDHGFQIDKLPAPLDIFCVAQCINSFVVDPDGELYRCFNYVGDKTRSIGNISQDPQYSHPEFTRLFKFDPFENDSCRDCDILPICMGGCPSRRDDRGLEAAKLCDSWRYNLEPMLDIIARNRYRAAPQTVQPTKETK